MGPVTRSGCGAICPAYGRDCYSCYGPAENINTRAMANRLQGLGLVDDEVARRFLFINSGSESFHKEGVRWQEQARRKGQ